MPRQVITRPSGGAAPYTYELGTTDTVSPSAIYATFDGSGAATAFLPCVTYYTQDGLVFARSFPSESVAAGASADVSYFPGGGLDGGSGIQFDTYPQNGGYLYIDTTGQAPAGAGSVSLNFDGNPFGVQVTSDDPSGTGDSFVSFIVAGDNNAGYSVDTGGVANGGVIYRVFGVNNSGIRLLTGDAGGSPIQLQSTAGGGIALSQIGDGFGISINDASADGISMLESDDGGIRISDFGAGGVFVAAEAGGSGGVELRNAGSGGVLIDSIPGAAGGITVRNDGSGGVLVTSSAGTAGGVQVIDAGSGGVQIRANGSNGIQMSTGGSNTIDIVSTSSAAAGIRSAVGSSVTLLTTGTVILSGGGGVDVRLGAGRKLQIGDNTPTIHVSITETGHINANNLPTSSAGLAAGDIYRSGAGSPAALMIV